MRPILSVKNLSKAERLFAWRKLNSLTINAAAKLLGVGKTQYFEMEHGRVDGPAPGLPPVLPPPLLFRLLRRRSGWSLAEAAKRAKTSHVTFLRHENEGKLDQFWKKQAKQRVSLVGKK